MVLKAPLQKESPNQSLPKVSSEAGVRRCSSKMFFFLQTSQYLPENICVGVSSIKLKKRPQHMCFLVNIAKSFDSKPPLASVDLLFLIKSNVGRFLQKKVDLG